jgi:hypothetical protein
VTAAFCSADHGRSLLAEAVAQIHGIADCRDGRWIRSLVLRFTVSFMVRGCTVLAHRGDFACCAQMAGVMYPLFFSATAAIKL